MQEKRKTLLPRALLLVAALAPVTWIIVAFASGYVTGDEVKFIQHVTGDTILVALLVTLSVTPLRRITGRNELIRYRRFVGLTAFWYAVLHLLTYLVFDHALSPSEIAKDIAKHPWVLVGFTAFLLLVPLAITSTKGWIRRLGGRRWQRLHRLIYPAAIAGVLHYLWLVKKDVTAPRYYAAVLAVLLLLRLWKAPTGQGKLYRMFGLRRQARSLAIVLLLAAPGVGGTWLPLVHACFAPPTASGHSEGHERHGHTKAPSSCHCVGACQVGGTTLAAGGPVIAAAVPSFILLVPAPSGAIVAPDRRTAHLLPPATAPPILL